MAPRTPRSVGFACPRVAAIGLALALALGQAGCGLRELHAMPPHLLGAWTTVDPAYDGRTLEIHPERVVLADLGRPIDRYHVEGIRRAKEKQGLVYEIRCTTDEGVRDELRLTLVAGSPAYLQVGEAPAHWTRSRAP